MRVNEQVYGQIFSQHPVTACFGAHSDADWNGLQFQQYYHFIKAHSTAHSVVEKVLNSVIFS